MLGRGRFRTGRREKGNLKMKRIPEKCFFQFNLNNIRVIFIVSYKLSLNLPIFFVIRPF